MSTTCPKCGKDRFGDDLACWFCNTPYAAQDISGGSEDPGGELSPGETPEEEAASEELIVFDDLVEELSGDEPKERHRPNSREAFHSHKTHERKRENSPAPAPAPIPVQAGKPKGAMLALVMGAMIMLGVAGAVLFLVQGKEKGKKISKENRSAAQKKRTAEARRQKILDRARRLKEQRSSLKKEAEESKKRVETDFAKAQTERIDKLMKKCLTSNSRSACISPYYRLKSLTASPHRDAMMLRVLKKGCSDGASILCRALCNFSKESSEPVTEAQKAAWCEYSCTEGKQEYQCTRLAMDALHGGQVADNSERFVTGLCTRGKSHCWNEAEVLEVLAWQRLGQKPQKPDDSMLWYSPIKFDESAQSLATRFKTWREYLVAESAIAPYLAFFSKLSEAPKRGVSPSISVKQRYLVAATSVHNASCSPVSLVLKVNWGFSQRSTLGDGIPNRFCYSTGKGSKLCQTQRATQGGTPETMIPVTIPAHTTRSLFFEVDTSKLAGSPPALGTVTLTPALVTWPKGAICKAPTKKELLTLSGSVRHIRAVYERSCDLNKAKNPGYEICRYMAKLGRHTLKELVTLCNGRRPGEAYVDGACLRIKQRFNIEPPPFKKTHSSSSSNTTITTTGGTNIRVINGMISVTGSGKGVIINGKSGKEAEKELRKYINISR